jgi:Tfp pilus assembly protein PilF
MAQAQAELRLDALTGISAHEEALCKIEAIVEDAHAKLARRKSNGFIRRGIKAFRRGDVARAAKLALAGTEADDTNPKAFHVLAMALEKMGHVHKALVTYERAFQLDPNDPELLLNLGLTAWNQQVPRGAEQMFRLYIQACPESPLGYNNLGSVQSDLGDPDTAIDTLRSAIYRMPQEAILWNSLATVLAEQGRVAESLTFYEEASRLDTTFAKPLHNIAYAYAHLGQLDRALSAYDRALEITSDEIERIETTHSRAICLIGMGRLEQGFTDYEIRVDPRFRAYIHNMTKAPYWDGGTLQGKRILVSGEQGLGDEIMFANVLPDLAKAVGPDGKLLIAVDSRLVALFQRSFPQAQVGTYDDRILKEGGAKKDLRFMHWAEKDGPLDYFALMGSVLQFTRKRVEDFPHQAFLTPDPARVADFRKRLEALGNGPFVGLCWRSMMLGAKRAKYYTALDTWGPILKTPGVTFVNLQYGDCQEELARASALHGVKIHAFNDLDLKNDIDGAAALSAALDLAISAPTAAAATAASVGTEVWFLTAGRTWPQLNTDHYPWYRATKVLSPEDFGDWTTLMPRVSEQLSEFVRSGVAARK